YGFFGAPVGLIFGIDARLARHSWLDLGLFVQNVMIAAKARGIEAPRRFVWKPTATIGGGRSAVWACGQVAERLVHMPMRP
ncbi:hypothetical protein VXE44_23685, partial [Acinetobacter nosocomialis]